jgi:glycine/D-amino acid oxidase-like deaminating enzyme
MAALPNDPHDRSREPWWTIEAPLEPPAPALAGEIEADVAIAGGGFTGLWTALSLLSQRPGARVVILDALRCGDGASARNGGFMHGYWSLLDRLSHDVGDDAALEVARSGDGLFAGVRDLGEDVWLREGGMLLVSAAPAHDEHVRRAVATAERLGVPDEAVLVEKEALPIRSPRFREAVRFRDCATVQPARLVTALRRAVVAAGARLHEHSPVVQLDAGRLRTPGGVVRAEEIVVATNASAAAWPPLARRLKVFESAIVLTEPVPDLAERVGWQGREAVFDGRTYLSYFRTTNDDRVLMGSASGVPARAERVLRELFPALADVRVEHRWVGAIDVSSDRFPIFGTVHGTRIHYAAGFTGNGVGPSWLAGRILAALALGEQVDSPLVTRRVPQLPPEPLRTLGALLVRRALLAVDEAEAAGRRPPLAARGIASLPRALGLRVASR